MSADPYRGSMDKKQPQSLNRYAYAWGDPVNSNDPTGLCIINGEEFPDPCFGVSTGPDDGGDAGGGFGGGGGGTDPNAPTLEAPPDFSYPQQYTQVASLSPQTLKVDAALISLRNALNSDSKCLNFLESGIVGGSGNLSTFNQNYNTLSGAYGGVPLAGAANFRGTQYDGYNAITGWIGSAFYITINTSGAFFNAGVGVGYANNYDSQVSAIQGGTPQAQFFVLLHELAHFFKAQGFIDNDATRGQQEGNNDMLWNNCSKTIQSAGRGGIL